MLPDSKSADLADRCREEVEHFLLGSKIESTYCYDLFRMACVRGDQEAWKEVYSIFSFLARRWVSKNSLYQASSESMDSLVNQAFFTFSRYVTPERFSKFPTLGSLLAYLRRCTSTAVVDAWRRVHFPGAGRFRLATHQLLRRDQL